MMWFIAHVVNFNMNRHLQSDTLEERITLKRGICQNHLSSKYTFKWRTI